MPDASGGSSFRLSRTSCQRGHGTGRPARSRCDRRDAPRLADRRLAAGERHGLEVRQALEPVEVAAQQLAAPERSVGAVPRAVEDERERGPLLAVLGEARGGVRVVVLDADELRVLLERPFRREVLGVEVVGDDVGLDAEHREVEREVAAERRVRGRRVEVAEVRREERLAATRDAERALELGADGDDRAVAGDGAAASAGAYPRERRIGKPARTTESSQRRWIGRSCARKASAIPPSRARASSSSNAIGSSETFPLVSTNGPPKSAASRW